MPTALICYDGEEKISGLIDSLTELPDWHLIPHNLQYKEINGISSEYSHLDLHYLIYTVRLSPDSINDLKIIINDNPLTCVIYYNSFLVNQQFKRLAEIGVSSCIVGLERKRYLKEYLNKIWLNHWKRVPESIFAGMTHPKSARAKKIIRYLENRPLTEFTPAKISVYLNISQSHFRAEFKAGFGINFREFRQLLYNHYESRLLLSRKYKPCDIYKILNYKHIANYSRSFRTRHGDCWRKLKSSI
jgi:AraC-like DNA-binding protein